MKLRHLAGTNEHPAGFPPHSCGGLIEAMTWQPPSPSGWGVFPRIRAGASLKQVVLLFHMKRGVVFPRIRAGASLKR